MYGLIRAFARLVPLVLIAGCGPKSPAIISEPLQPAAGAPITWLVGSLGPAAMDDAATHQRLMFRPLGAKDGVAAWWGSGAMEYTPADIQGEPAVRKDSAPGTASVFVLPLKPGEYEFYDISFFWPGGDNLSISARKPFSIPMRLEAGKAYYIGEFRSRCEGKGICFFIQRDQKTRDEPIARRYTPNLPVLQSLQLDMKPALPLVFPAPDAQAGGRVNNRL